VVLLDAGETASDTTTNACITVVKTAENRETIVPCIVKWNMLDLMINVIWAARWREKTTTNGLVGRVTQLLLFPVWTHIIKSTLQLTTAMVIVTDTKATKTVIETICTVWKLTCKKVDHPWMTATMDNTTAMPTSIWTAVVKTAGSWVNIWWKIQTETSTREFATLIATCRTHTWTTWAIVICNATSTMPAAK